ncbi:hypothetical protein [Caulobacter sp. 17J65-9]|uniref:hypothetical protein n=1 Tax=Caulobacter sp. 17J65-9 TaxID=2709382 RepID=UPI0013CB3F0C|nr:hypothetical protein [Caulobacter sp. 17J65-9]NEX92438.1 hypothetical protein [Caulobacter sp. 17J65-9]
MLARFNTWLAAAAGLAVLALAGPAAARCCTATPPCCTAPPPPPPPSTPCCTGGHTVNVPGVNVVVSGAVVVNASASASASASAGASAGGVVFIGGGSSWYVDQPQPGLIQGLNVETAAEAEASAHAVAAVSTRTVTRRVAIQAVCLDDRAVPHPASQVRPDREVDETYDGEIFRCLAGSRMQATVADYSDALSFDRGETIACVKGEALYHAPGGQVACRTQKPARDCNERSLLRRYGAGVKVLTMSRTETYRREETEASASASARASAGSSLSISLDGGVGGIVR